MRITNIYYVKSLISLDILTSFDLLLGCSAMYFIVDFYAHMPAQLCIAFITYYPEMPTHWSNYP